MDWFSSLDFLLFSDNPDNQGQSYHTPADLSYGVHTLSFVLFENDIELVSDSISLTINGLPIIETVDLMPLNPQPNESLLCFANAYDEDGGALDLDFEFRNLTTGDVYPPDLISASDATLDLSMTDVLPGSLVQCEVSATVNKEKSAHCRTTPLSETRQSLKVDRKIITGPSQIDNGLKDCSICKQL